MPSPRYRADPPEARAHVALEGFALIYHRPSGITHILASPAPEILDALSDAPGDAAAIAAHLAARHDLEAEGDVEAVVAARLEELEAVGLVARL